MTGSPGSAPTDPSRSGSTRPATDPVPVHPVPTDSGPTDVPTDPVPVHLGIVIPSLHGGGAEFVCRQWIAELARRGHRVTVYVYDRRQPVVPVPDGVSVEVFRPRWSPMRRLILPLWLKRTIADTAPAAVLSMLTYSNLVTLAASLLGSDEFPPVAISERTLAGLALTRERLRDRLVRALARFVYRRAQAGIAISHPVAVDMLTTFKMRPDRVFVVPNPVLSADAIGSAPRNHRGSDEAGLHLAFVGRLVGRKRPELFLAVVDHLRSEGISVRATVIGEGPLRAALERAASERGLPVTFVGWREPWWTAAERIDCVVVASRVEGFANVLVEAAAEGIRCVASGRALGVADAIIPGSTGELAMADSASDLACAVLRAVERRPADPVMVQGWLARFSVENSADCLLQALDHAIVERRR